MAAILKVRDNNGNIINLPSLQGKSAYEYAKDAGFTGTEEEFGEQLANTVTKEYVDQYIQETILGGAW